MATKPPPQIIHDDGNGKVIIADTPADLETIDVSDKELERMARGYILGTTRIRNNQQIRAKLEDRVSRRIGTKGKFLVDKLFELAEGVYTVRKEDGKSILYYKQPPNLQAIMYMLDRVLGKPVVHTVQTEEKKGIILIEQTIKNLAKPQPNGSRTGDVIDVRPTEESRTPQEAATASA